MATKKSWRDMRRTDIRVVLMSLRRKRKLITKGIRSKTKAKVSRQEEISIAIVSP